LKPGSKAMMIASERMTARDAGFAFGIKARKR